MITISLEFDHTVVVCLLTCMARFIFVSVASDAYGQWLLLQQCLPYSIFQIDGNVLQAADDPIAPRAAIPFKAIEENEHCMLVVTPAGGHLGWVSGAEAPLGRNPHTLQNALPGACQDWPCK